MAKTLWSFGRSECHRVKICPLFVIVLLSHLKSVKKCVEILLAELQIRRSNKDNLGIIIQISSEKHIL